METQKAFEGIIYYCIKKKIELVNSNVWSYDHDGNIITEVWRGRPTKRWVYTMLHELGHALSYKSKGFSYRSWKLFEIGESIAIDKVATVQIMREEMEAWDNGLKIAKKLDISIDKKDYDKFASECLLKYMRELPNQYDSLKNKRK